ncbi:MAG: inositol monophosphatase [Rhodospirillaceae bacterium]|nr:inositol monophosphatase [Rhodospirillaceae bacterium]
MPSLDPNAVIGALREVAETIILPRYNNLEAEQIRTKSNAHDVVTVADEESEQHLAVTLPKLLPGSILIGEESVAKNAELLNHIASHEWVWIVDPVDGTLNFVNGRPTFCTMAALVHKGETVWGFIHDPLRNATLWAERGAGAFISNANEPPVKLSISTPADLKMSGLNAAIYDKDMAPIKGKFGRISRSGCAGHDYWAAAEGRLHVVSFRKLMPWDHAPGVLIHAEAGGYTRLLSGDAYEPGKQSTIGILAAPNEQIWAEIVATRQNLE